MNGFLVLVKVANTAISTRIVAAAYMNQRVYKPMVRIPAHGKIIKEPHIQPACQESRPISIEIKNETLLVMRESEPTMNPIIE